jgi:hypothetical protein
MKKNKKSVSVKNTKSFLGNPPALANTTFFVPAANLNANDGIFTDLHDNPSNFSPSNQDPNWQFDISKRVFSESNKKKIFSDDKFKNMINYNQDTYTGDMFSDYFVPVENYYGVESAVSPVLAEVDFPRYQSDVDPQPVSVGIAPVDSNYFAPLDENIFAKEPKEKEIPRYYSPVEPQPISVGIAPVDADYFAPSDDFVFAASKKEGYTMPTEVENPTYQSDVELQSVSVGRGYADGIYLPDMEVREIFSPLDYETTQKSIPTDKTNLSIEQIKTLGISEADYSRFSDEDLIKLIGQEEFDRVVASRFRDGMLISPPPTPEMVDNKGSYPVDPLPDKNNVETDSIQPITLEDDKKAKKPFNWLPIILVAAAVGGYMYYNRKK